MHRKKLTLEVLSKSLACFSFGFLLGYLTFTLISHPAENKVYAEEEQPADLPSEKTEEKTKESSPNLADPLYPKTYSDLPETPYSSEPTLLHNPKPSFIHIYNYAKYPVVYYSPSPDSSSNFNSNTNVTTDSAQESEPATELETPTPSQESKNMIQ